jgi:hypothetical protein
MLEFDLSNGVTIFMEMQVTRKYNPEHDQQLLNTMCISTSSTSAFLGQVRV